ncbi:MAG: J domain-containing protein [Bacteroidales bacterium]|nr:J domain-containing protein [Bacteroidales bacterium]
MKDYYKILGLTRDASPDLIRQRFRELAFENHPDVSDKENAAEIFIEIYEAYQLLSQPDKKARYDLLYDKYIIKAGIPVPDEEHIKTDIQNVTYSAREKAQEKAKTRYGDFIKDMECHFMPGMKADGSPYIYNMHKNIGISGGTGPMGSIRSKIINIPIPRSRKAYLYHQTGLFIKVLFFVLAILVFRCKLLSEYSPAVRIISAFSLIITGGLITMGFYNLEGVRSKFFHAGTFPLVRKYKQKGYRRGFHPMISTTPAGVIAFLLRLFF